MSLSVWKSYDPTTHVMCEMIAVIRKKSPEEIADFLKEHGILPVGMYSGRMPPRSFLYDKDEVVSVFKSATASNKGEVPTLTEFDSSEMNSRQGFADFYKVNIVKIGKIIDDNNVQPVAFYSAGTRGRNTSLYSAREIASYFESTVTRKDIVKLFAEHELVFPEPAAFVKSFLTIFNIESMSESSYVYDRKTVIDKILEFKSKLQQKK